LDAGGLLRAALGLILGGQSLADDLGLPPAPVRAVIMATASSDTRACALGFDRVGASPSWRQKASLLARAVIPTSGYLRAVGGPADTTLASRYGRRLLRLTGVIGGYRAWRSAVRACGASRRVSDRVEVAVWSLIARAGIRVGGPTATLRVLDRIPLRRHGGEELAATDRDALFRLAGRCLGESTARSQYLRVRGRRHRLVLGVASSPLGLRSHAWLEPMDAPPPGFEVIHSFDR
jgi:hypothetical protein